MVYTEYVRTHLNMSSPLTHKRRRLNGASRGLSKPFVSPMRSAQPSERTPLKPVKHATNTSYLPSTHAHTTKLRQIAHSTDTSSDVSKLDQPTDTPLRKQTSFPSSAKRADPAEVAAHKTLTALERQIKALRNELDTLSQAAQLVASASKDAELEGLTDKWRHVSQQVAEELFGTVKERVCRMGGVQAWRDSEKQKHERANGVGEWAQEPEKEDDADCEFDSQGEELPEEEQEFRKKEKRRVRQEAMDAADDGGREEVRGDDGGGGKKAVWQELGEDEDVSLSFMHCGNA